MICRPGPALIKARAAVLAAGHEKGTVAPTLARDQRIFVAQGVVRVLERPDDKNQRYFVGRVAAAGPGGPGVIAAGPIVGAAPTRRRQWRRSEGIGMLP